MLKNQENNTLKPLRNLLLKLEVLKNHIDLNLVLLLQEKLENIKNQLNYLSENYHSKDLLKILHMKLDLKLDSKVQLYLLFKNHLKHTLLVFLKILIYVLFMVIELQL